MAGFIFPNAYLGLQKLNEPFVESFSTLYDLSLRVLGGKELKYLLGDGHFFGDTI
jgi:hypothetical protein